MGIDIDYGPILASAASLGGSYLQYAGTEKTNVANAIQAQEQMKFQERMSSTAYQRAVADMRAAGLNPALAYQQGGSSTPGGASAQMQNAMGAFRGSAGEAVNTYNEIATQTANRKNIEAQTAKTNAEKNQLNIESAARLDDIIQHARATAMNAKTNSWGVEQEIRNKQQAYDQSAQSFAVRMQQLFAALDATQATASNTRADTLLKNFAAPEAKNRAGAANTWFGRTIAPYITHAGQASGIMKNVVNLVYP
jgi:hypothetical protein